MLRETYAEIDLANIKSNIRLLKAAAGTDVMAVVKADAYGHGMVEVSRAARDEGVRAFAVATPDEAVELRRAIPDAMILVLSPAWGSALAPLIEADISVCACDAEGLREIAAMANALGKKARVHVKTDTGMGRVGLRTEAELGEVLGVFKTEEKLVFEGIFTHFATADEKDLTFAREQLEKFKGFCALAEKEGFEPLRHASNSAAILVLGDAHFDICRMGISMYGYPPSGDVEAEELKPAMRLVSHISYIKTIPAGASVSYGRQFTANRETVVATVPIGYADGYNRRLSGKAKGLLNGKVLPQIGRVCMDQIMFDATGAEVHRGDEIVLMWDGFDADDMAAIAGTISYEILTSVTKRVPRKYING